MDTSYMNHAHMSREHAPEPMDLSTTSSPGTSPCASDFTELLPYSTSSSYSIDADCNVLLSPVSTVASPSMHHIVKQYAMFPDTPINHLPTPPNSGKMIYPQWSPHFAMESGPGPNEDVTIPHEFYMPERCTPEPDTYMGSYPLGDSQNQLHLSQASTFFVPSPHLASNGPPRTQDNCERSVDSPNTLETTSEVSTPCDGAATPSAEATKRAPRERATPTASDMTGTESDAKIKEEDESDDDMPCITKVSKPAKRTGRKVDSLRSPVSFEGDEHTNCFGKTLPPTLKENCPDEERCIFESRWLNREKKGQDMWDSIQEDYFRRFKKESGKETLQMKLSRGRSKYIEWLERDEELLIEAWQNMERNRYKTLLQEFYKLGGSRNMMLSPGDVECKTVTDLALEEEIYVEGVNEMELRRRCRFLSGRKRGGKSGTDEPGISYCGPSLFGRAVDEDEVIDQVLSRQSKASRTRKTVAQRRTKTKSRTGPKKIKLELK